MTPALLLIDLQNDYLERGTLVPPVGDLVDRCAFLLGACRRQQVPIVHAQTRIRADGTNRMPHWKRDDYWACVEGTRGCEAPAPLEPRAGERVLGKSFFSAFSAAELDECLRDHDVDTVVLAGVYLHACVSATALDAYQRGYKVWVASDAVATMTREQAEVAEDFLSGRAATFLGSAEIVARLSAPALKRRRSAPRTG